MADATLSLRLPPTFENVDRVRLEVQELCRRRYRQPGVEGPLGDLLLAIAEAMNNAVEHSRAAEMEIEVEAGARSLVFRLLTGGEPFDPTVSTSFPDLDAPAGLPEGGFGRALIASLTDRVAYEYHQGKNVLTIEKQLMGRAGMEIRIGMEGNVAVVELTGDFVASAVEQFKAQMAKLMEKNSLFVVLNLDKVNFMDSSGLGACMAAHKAFQEKKGALVCANPSEAVAKIFRVTRADQKLKVAPTSLDGVKTLQGLSAGQSA